MSVTTTAFCSASARLTSAVISVHSAPASRCARSTGRRSRENTWSALITTSSLAPKLSISSLSRSRSSALPCEKPVSVEREIHQPVTAAER